MNFEEFKKMTIEESPELVLLDWRFIEAGWLACVTYQNEPYEPEQKGEICDCIN